MDEFNRRQFVTQLAKTCLGVGMLPLVGSYVNTPCAAITPHSRARAQHVIYLNMSGAMSHIDTFDPKPGTASQGPVQPIATNVDGIQLSEFLPNIASQMHNAALVRSVVTSQGAHEQASYLMHTSYQKRGTISHPTFGSWVSKLMAAKTPQSRTM